MLSRDRLMRMQVHQFLDACIVAVGFWLAYQVWTAPAIREFFQLAEVKDKFKDYVVYYVILIVVAPVLFEIQGFYNRPILYRRGPIFWRLLKSCFILSLGLVVALFFSREQIARGVVVWFGMITFGLVLMKEELVRLVSKSSVARAQLRRGFVLLGNPEEIARMRAELRLRNQEEIEVLTELDVESTPVEKLVETLHEHSANGVLVSARKAHFDKVEQAIRACELEGVEIWLVADFFQTQISRTSLDDFYGRPVLVFRSAPETSLQGVLKQLMDILLASVLLVAGLPLYLLIALLIKLSSPGPVLFRQQRSGLNGRPFTLYKFRTMVTNAEQLKHELAAMNEMTGPVFKVSNDPRVTAVGRFLRKYSLDEFPQLYNVLRGEMSLVGPRPLPVDEVRRFHDLAHRRRLSVKPGLTCLWQISGRSEVRDFREWVRLDLEYIDNWSLWLDLKILCRTVPVVLTGAGAK